MRLGVVTAAARLDLTRRRAPVAEHGVVIVASLVRVDLTVAAHLRENDEAGRARLATTVIAADAAAGGASLPLRSAVPHGRATPARCERAHEHEKPTPVTRE